ncbi:unnamed protein product [Lymnaea stagnalis]|uniref:Ig-like domain-containing protein n=1 Tax=Lymnaea stagnalis TaxID=6523 RepID=A0AAV2HGH4_LYMST
MSMLRVFIGLICWIGTSSCQDAPLAMNFTYQMYENSSKVQVTLTCLATGYPEKMTLMKLGDNSMAQHIVRSRHKSYLLWKVLLLDASCHDAGTYKCAVTGQHNLSTTLEVPQHMLKCKDGKTKHLLAVLVTLSLTLVIIVNGILLYFGIRQKNRHEKIDYVRWTENMVFSGNRTEIEMPIENMSACQDDVVQDDQQAVTSSEKLTITAAVALHDSYYSNPSSETGRVEAVKEESELIYGTTCEVMRRESLTTEDGYESTVVLREKLGVQINDCYHESSRKDTTYVLEDTIPCEESSQMGTMHRPSSNRLHVKCLEEPTSDAVKHKSSDETLEAGRRLGSVEASDLY